MQSDQARMRLIVDAKSERNALRVVERLRRLIEAEITSIEPYHKGGFDARLALPVDAVDWPTRVVSLVQKAQSIGYGWIRNGDIETDISLTNDRFSIPGLEFATLALRRLGSDAPGPHSRTP